MPTTGRFDPLNKYPAIRTSDVEEFRHTLLSLYGATGLSVPDPNRLKTRGNFLQFSDIALGFSACGSRAIVNFSESDFARIQFALRGRSTATADHSAVEVDAHQTCVNSPGVPVTLDYEENSEHLVLRIKSAAIRRKLAAMLGAAPKGDVMFAPVVAMTLPQSRTLKALVGFLIGQVDHAEPGLPVFALKELKQSIITTFLFSCHHAYRALLDRDTQESAPHYVRRTEEYIEAHWDEAITIEKICEITEHSARAIFKAFKQSRGYSPMAFAKQVRLRHAREMLSSPTPDTSVTGVAFACSFSNLGHFAKDYRQAFQERPSETLHRAKTT
ncbi:MAG: AraC family transcriptional regulator [Rhizobiales bacterium]|nr:AraC family transcriptional regulator [Hyphomicrobiales bacterium]